MKNFFDGVPFVYIVALFVFIAVGATTITYTFSKCGAKAFLLGNGGLYAAASGLCD
jgi:hypothetical protein